MGTILMLGLMAVAFIGLNMFSKRSNQKRIDEKERMIREELVPGVWVHTSVGFFGRFVEIDGDVLILETPSGEETYWNKAVIRSVGDLPFEAEEDAEDMPELDAAPEEEVAVEEATGIVVEDDTEHKE